MEQLKKLAYAQKSSMISLFVLSLLTGASVVSQAYLIVKIVDEIFLKGSTFEESLPSLILLLIIFIIRAVLNFLNGRTGIKLSSIVKKNIRKQLLYKYVQSPIQAAQTGQSGHKVSVMMDAVDEIDSYFSQYIPQMIQTTIVPLLLLIVISTQHVYTSLIILVTAPFIPIAMIIVGKKTKKKSDAQLEKMTAFSGRFLDTLQGLTTLKLFGKSASQKEMIRKSSLDFREATMDVLKVAFLSSLALEFIANLSVGIIALEIGFRMVIFENISFFTAFFVLTLVPEFFLGLRQLGSAFHTGRSSMSAAALVAEELAKADEPVQWGNKSFRHSDVPPTIGLRQIEFSYGNEGFSLKEIQLQIPSYGKVAIVGRSGSGKSTLLHLIAGLLQQTKGEILVNGQPRSDSSEKEWFSQLSYISQQPYLFSGTIMENIVIGFNTDATSEEVMIAVEKAGISELVASLPLGLETPIGEAGRGLSGGEKQRIAIARAFLKRPSIILFDEPTTGLDLQTEQIVQCSMQELSKESTVITVAHRLHTIKSADQIVFLDNGHLIATGTHEELLKTVPDYLEMVSIQAGGEVS